MLDFWKQRRQRRLLAQLSQGTRNKRIANLSDIRQVGIVFSVGDKESWDTLYHFAKELEQGGRTVWMLGAQAADMSIDYVFTHPRMTIVHEKTDLDFFGVPKPELTAAFLSPRYDLLIDATQEPNFLAKYVSAQAHADLKVTHVDGNAMDGNEKERIFDFLIRSAQPMGVAAYLQETMKYLSMIRK